MKSIPKQRFSTRTISGMRTSFDGTNQIKKIRLDGKVHNNIKMERLNGETPDTSYPRT